MASVSKIVTSGTGQSADFIRCGPGDHVLELTWTGSAGDADVQHRHANDTAIFRDLYDSNGVVNNTANRSYRVSGNQDYTVDVNTHTSVLHVTATSCG